ncbi:MAG: hypothetical protein VZQ48_01415 [Candidatus Cryptobacteroides sp.]|nr:hypothetical protein [Candidatus Cryptobacteroides sp.]
MKKTMYFVLFAALTVGLMSCKREELAQDNAKDEVKEVTTKFVFNIATNTATKQSADAVQVTENSASPAVFRGLEKATLLTYSLEDSEHIPTNGKILAEDATADKAYDLSNLISSGGVSAESSHRVIEMSLPLKTNTLLLYGKAPEGTSPAAGVENWDYYGHMDTYSVSKDAGSANFVIGKRLKDAEADDYHMVEKVIAGILTVGMNTFIPAGSSWTAAAVPSGGSNPYGFAVTNSIKVSWSQYATSNNSPVTPSHLQYPLEEKMGHVYKAMTTIKDAELRSGAGAAIERTIQDMWSVINEVRCAAPLNVEEAYAKYLAQLVHRKISLAFTAASIPADGAAVTGVAFKPSDEYAEQFASDEAQWPTSSTAVRVTEEEVKSVKDYEFSKFPINFDLPRGGCHYKFNTDNNYFYYVQEFNTSGMQAVSYDEAVFGVHSYYYPAELMYFGNSPIRVSNDSNKVGDYPAGSENEPWETDGSWSTGGWGSGAGHVVSTTHSVAMMYNVNYGNALLKTQVKYGVGTLYDNNHKIQKDANPSLVDPTSQNAQNGDEPNRPIAVNGTTFSLTGIIVGGQPHKVGWDYLQVKENVGGVDKYVYGFIYDAYIPTASQAIPTYTSAGNPSKAVYTSVLDNYMASEGTTQPSCFIALEFKNNGDDFYGLNNLIRKDGYFYLIGQLDPSGKTVNWPANYKIPPYNADGTSMEIVRAFIQDYMTTVTFTLGENSLKYAYLTVPDLRSSSLTLGLAVDMEWSTGIDFGDVILGGN